jgi:hypothetical protein
LIRRPDRGKGWFDPIRSTTIAKQSCGSLRHKQTHEDANCELLRFLSLHRSHRTPYGNPRVSLQTGWRVILIPADRKNVANPVRMVA